MVPNNNIQKYSKFFADYQKEHKYSAYIKTIKMTIE